MLIFTLTLINQGLVSRVAIHDTDTHSARIYADITVDEGLQRLMIAPQICGHDAIAHLVPAIQKTRPWFKPEGVVLDTYVLSRLAFPNLKETDKSLHLEPRLVGSHSLEAWNRRFNKAPVLSDLSVTLQLLERVREADLPKEAVALEHQVATIVARQVARGVHFDREAACTLYQELLSHKDHLLGLLRDAFPPTYGAGEQFIPQSDNARLGYSAGAALTLLEVVHLDPGNRQQVALALMRKYGWTPKRTKTGEPELTDDTLGSLPYPEAAWALDYLMVEKRLQQLRDGQEGWLRHVSSQNRIHGQVNTLGTATSRMTHHSPALNQVPTVKKPYGHACRSLFGPTPGYKLVGVDATQLELVMLAHYLAGFDKGEYARLVTEGDSHQSVADLAGLTTRDEGKTLTYKLIYGGRAEPEVEQRFFARMPAFKRLLDAVRSRGKERGFLTALDGRRVYTKDVHSMLNFLLQTAGAIVMKRALVMLDQKLQAKGFRPGIDYEFVLNVHDEFQLEVIDAIIQGVDAPHYVAEMAQKAITAAGQFYKLALPLGSKTAIGNSWAETH